MGTSLDATTRWSRGGMQWLFGIRMRQLGIIVHAGSFTIAGAEFAWPAAAKRGSESPAFSALPELPDAHGGCLSCSGASFIMNATSPAIVGRGNTATDADILYRRAIRRAASTGAGTVSARTGRGGLFTPSR